MEVVAVLRGDPRWSSIVLILAGSIALGLNGGLHFLVIGLRRSLRENPTGQLRGVQRWLAVPVVGRLLVYLGAAVAWFIIVGV